MQGVYKLFILFLVVYGTNSLHLQLVRYKRKARYNLFLTLASSFTNIKTYNSTVCPIFLKFGQTVLKMQYKEVSKSSIIMIQGSKVPFDPC